MCTNCTRSFDRFSQLSHIDRVIYGSGVRIVIATLNRMPVENEKRDNAHQPESKSERERVENTIQKLNYEPAKHTI